jgi:hypothetical protein
MAAIWDVIPQFAESLKSEFSSYLDELMPELLFKANLEIDIHISEVDQPMAGYHHIALTIPGFGERIIAANTTKLTSKDKVHRNYLQPCQLTKHILFRMGSSDPYNRTASY